MIDLARAIFDTVYRTCVVIMAILFFVLPATLVALVTLWLMGVVRAETIVQVGTVTACVVASWWIKYKMVVKHGQT